MSLTVGRKGFFGRVEGPAVPTVDRKPFRSTINFSQDDISPRKPIKISDRPDPDEKRTTIGGPESQPAQRNATLVVRGEIWCAVRTSACLADKTAAKGRCLRTVATFLFPWVPLTASDIGYCFMSYQKTEKVLQATIDRQEATLKASYSDKTFNIIGSPEDDSAFNRIATEGGNWEPQVMDVMAALVRPTDVCLDIGANLGTHTMVLADLASQGNVFAFEPSSLNAAYLRENIQANKLENARCVQIALGRSRDVKELTNIPGLEGCSFVTPDGDVDLVMEKAWGQNLSTTTESVDVETLDHWIDENEIKHVDFVKMDVEGSEPAVLEGGLATFERFRPTLIVEFNRNSLSFYYGEQPSEFYDRLSELYPFMYIIHDERGLQPTRVTSFNEIEPLLDNTKSLVGRSALSDSAL
jgi:FkbM family methyltransferase